MKMASASCGAISVTRIKTTLPIPFASFASRRPTRPSGYPPLAWCSAVRSPNWRLKPRARAWCSSRPAKRSPLHRVPLPSRKRSTWARAVPYALEDQVVEDIETLHFALGSAPEDDHLPVAVINRDTLRGWLDACTAAGLVPAAIIPEPLLLPLAGRRLEPGAGGAEDRGAHRPLGRLRQRKRDLLDLLWNQTTAEAGAARPQRLRVWGHPPPALAEADLGTAP